VLIAAAILLTALDRGITTLRISNPLRVRVVAVSLLVVTIGSAWAVERSPW
jgi:hypothetical protein